MKQPIKNYPRKTPVTTAKRMAQYRQRMRAAGLRPVQIWVPDSDAPGFAAKCRRQAQAVATADPAGDDLMRFVADATDGLHVE